MKYIGGVYISDAYFRYVACLLLADGCFLVQMFFYFFEKHLFYLLYSYFFINLHRTIRLFGCKRRRKDSSYCGRQTESVRAE